MDETSMVGPDRAMVLFDGECNLCTRSVRFIAGRDPSGRFVFAPLQSDIARDLLGGAPPEGGGTVVLIEEGRVCTRSTAALRIARRLRWPWPLLWALMLVPRALRDAVYGFVARNRLLWFGRADACALPSPGLRERFLAPDRRDDGKVA